MSHKWESLGRVTDSGPTPAVAATQGQLWLGNGAGLSAAQLDDNGQLSQFAPVAREVPFFAVNSLLAAGPDLFVAGLPGGLIRSATAGKVWERAIVEPGTRPIVCLAASPNYARDGALLAGTAGDGVLRSVDRGRFWEFVNFGLRDFDIHALACAPVWARREHAAVLTGGGIYVSPNGGRAWRAAAPLDGVTALCYAAAGNGIALLAASEAGIFGSADHGQTWRPLADPPAAAPTTLLQPNRDGLVAGSADGALHAAAHAGAPWQPAGRLPSAILALAETAGFRVAGTADGVFIQSDAADAWRRLPDVPTRRAAVLAIADNEAAVSGPHGAWLAARPRGPWRALGELPPVPALASTTSGIWAIAGAEVRRLSDGVTAALPGPAQALAASGDRLWLGTRTGALFTAIAGDALGQWEQVSGPWRGAIVAVAVVDVPSADAPSVDGAPDRAVAVATLTPGTLTLWLRPSGAAPWRELAQRRCDTPAVRLALAGPERLAIAYAGTCAVFADGRWHTEAPFGREAPVTSLLADRDGALYATSAAGLHVWRGAAWHAVPGAPGALVASAATHNGIIGVDQGGALWRYRPPS